MQSEQQLLGISTVTRPSGRTLPPLTPVNTEAPPGFTSATIQPVGLGHGEQVGGRKVGWELLLPSGPTPAHPPPPYIPAAPFSPTLNMPGPEMTTSSVPSGIMKDISLFKNPFDIPRDQLLRYLSTFVVIYHSKYMHILTNSVPVQNFRLHSCSLCSYYEHVSDQFISWHGIRLPSEWLFMSEEKSVTHSSMWFNRSERRSHLGVLVSAGSFVIYLFELH